MVLTALSYPTSAVLDARTRERFAGQVEEPRPGLRSGHMPDAVNLPFGDLQVDGRMRPACELQPRSPVSSDSASGCAEC